MSADEAIGAAGVALLLGAFLLNLAGVWHHDMRRYQALNLLGAALACYASWRIGFVPFVVLEGTWAAVAAAALARGARAPAAAELRRAAHSAERPSSSSQRR